MPQGCMMSIVIPKLGSSNWTKKEMKKKVDPLIRRHDWQRAFLLCHLQPQYKRLTLYIIHEGDNLLQTLFACANDFKKKMQAEVSFTFESPKEVYEAVTGRKMPGQWTLEKLIRSVEQDQRFVGE